MNKKNKKKAGLGKQPSVKNKKNLDYTNLLVVRHGGLTSLDIALHKYKQLYPDLDDPSFTWGFVAGGNATLEDEKRRRRILRG